MTCKHCGCSEGFYREIEVQGVGWVSVEFNGNPDGTLLAHEAPDVQGIEWDDFYSTSLNYGCSRCGALRAVMEDLVEVAPEQIDPVLWRERHPIPGQLTMVL